ncbi:MAG: hypothetical protein ABSE48_06950 [Verrucomicrobiota bacterium]
MGLIFKDADNKPIDPKAARNRAILLSVPFALMGIFALVLLMHDGLLGGLNRQKAMGLLSAAIVCGGLIVLIFGINAKKMALKAAAIKPSSSEKPWLSRKDWAVGRIVPSSRKAVLLLWILVVFWCVVLGVISVVVLLPELHRGNHAALIALIFPAVGIAVLMFTINTTRAWRRFGQSIFETAAIPAPSGSALTGEIKVKMKLKPQLGIHLRLSCINRSTTGASNNRQASEKILWQDEKWLRPNLPQGDVDATTIPIFFKLPDKLPESSSSAGDGIHWKLEASATLRGPNFHVAFEVPVFKLSEIPVSAEDPTLPYQMSLDEVRQQIHSRIEVKDLPKGGKEFIFPAARNPGFASGATIVCLIWTASIIALVIWKHAPLPFLLVFSAIDLLMAAFTFDLWFRRSRVVVTSENVTVQRAWLTFKTEEHFKTSEIKSITSDVGANAGHTVYHDLKVHTRQGKESILAKNLNNKPEADWLIRQMIAAWKLPA